MFQVHRTDTGQFVLIDPATGTVVIEDELQVGYARIEALAAERGQGEALAAPPASAPQSPFDFKGRRNLTLMLTIGLPFVWFLFVYLGLRGLDRPSSEVESELETLRVEVEALRAELASEGKGEKPKRSKKGGTKSKSKAESKAESKPPAPAPAEAKSAPEPAAN